MKNFECKGITSEDIKTKKAVYRLRSREFWTVEKGRGKQ